MSRITHQASPGLFIWRPQASKNNKRSLWVTFAACPMAKTSQIQEVEKRVSPFCGEELQSHIAREWKQREDDMWLF